MKKYLTTTNIVIALLVIGCIILAIALMSKPQPVDNSAGLEVLQQQYQLIKQDNERLRADSAAIAGRLTSAKAKDSALLRQYEARILQDYRTIQQLKNRRDEKTDIINGADDSLLLSILAER